MKYNHYVKVRINKREVWLYIDQIKTDKNGDLIGKSLKDNKYYSFSPSDVLAFYSGNIKDIKGLGMAYVPASDVGTILDTIVPDSMAYETHISARIIEIKLKQSLDKYVAKKLHYTESELHKYLSAEQIDAIAMAVYNIEKKKQAIIIGDQTGIGKGRVAASIIRYGVLKGKKPIFVTEKPNLFSDIYRDLKDIGSENFKPFIVNNFDVKTKVKDDNGDVIYEPLRQNEQEKIFKTAKLPAEFDYIELTYSQVSSEKPTLKQGFIRKMAHDNIIILDESHNAGGNMNTSNTARYFYDIVSMAQGVIFLSATFAKRPDNMPLYACKTSMSEANMSHDELVEAVQKGGVALQEVLSAQLVQEGQMIRRERSFEGVEVNWILLDEKKHEHISVFDNITSVLRDIISFQENHVKDIVSAMDSIASAEGKEVEERKGTSKAGVDNSPFFSKVFQVINQILFSLKAKSVAELAVQHLENGKKPVIAFSSTMETFLEEVGEIGETVNCDFKSVLQKGLDSVLKYTVITPEGSREHKQFSTHELGMEAVTAYNEISNKINSISTGISLTPIDIIKSHVRNAGYTIDEVTGRDLEVQFTGKSESLGVLLKRKKLSATDAFRQFNNNELDCLMINQSGSTGASAHAIITKKVSANEVKQRVMIILQAELDINREVQKRGRINRTGQIMKPIYDYVMSVIPAEKRLMMMLRKKLKSLDANTTSNQKQSEKSIEGDDFLNKYGDKVVTDYLVENTDIAQMLDDPLKFETTNQGAGVIEGASSKVSGRVAVLSVDEQEQFYNEILERYNEYVDYLRQAGQYDLEVEALNLEAKTLDKEVTVQGKDGGSVFAENTYLEKCEVNVLKKPFTKDELQNIITKNLDNRNTKDIQNGLIQEVKDFHLKKVDDGIIETEEKYKKLVENITKEKKYQKLNTAFERENYIKNRERELNTASEEAVKMLKDKLNNQYKYIYGYISFFYIGKALEYPTFFQQTEKAVCVNIAVDRKKKNPFTPSNIKIQVAVANSTKYMSLALSGETARSLSEIMGNSIRNTSYDDESVIKNWQEYTEKSNVNRQVRYIVTGNILQGYAKFDNGKLISYTLLDGGIKKGILLPENYDPQKNIKDKFVNVPIGKAERYIMDLGTNSAVRSSDDKIVLYRENRYSSDNYSFTVPANRNYHNYIKDENIIALCNNPDGFERKSDRMVAYFQKENIPKLLQYLDKEFKLSIAVSKAYFSTYFDNIDDNSSYQKDNLTKEAEKIYEKDKQDFEKRKQVQQKVKSPKEVKSTIDEKSRKIKIAKAKMMMLKLNF
ncbi:MAG: strawberry notch family protein [Bacteroidales bacterium]|jgi:hypothetical protein|nr:strawberry notch family protein [Bacteroidales bacterium]